MRTLVARACCVLLLCAPPLANLTHSLSTPPHDAAIDWGALEESGCGEEAQDLIALLLTRDASQRPAANVIRAHTFFRPLDMAQLRRMDMPFIPRPANSTDTSYFERMSVHCSSKRTARSCPRCSLIYRSCSYLQPNVLCLVCYLTARNTAQRLTFSD